MMKKICSWRVLTLVLAVMLLGVTFTSCAGSSKPTLPFTDAGLNVVEGDKTALGKDDLKSVAQLFSDAYAKDSSFNGIEALVAANRGYDITGDDNGNDPNKTYDEKKYASTKDFAANVIKVIEKANEKAGDKALSNETLERVKKTLNGATEETLQADVDRLIGAFAQDIKKTNPNLIDTVMNAIGAVLNWITRYLTFGLNNYVLGICIFAIVIEILMLPLAVKQQKNSIKQAKLRPKEMAIKNKYKGRNDQPTMQKMQAEIQELYQRENFSPASGCLPLIVQLPVIMALYSIVINPLQYVLGQSSAVVGALNKFATTCKAAGGLGLSVNDTRGSIEMLSKLPINDIDGMIDKMGKFKLFHFDEGVLDSLGKALQAELHFEIGPVNFGMIPSFTFEGWSWVLLLVPVVTFATYFATAKLNRKFMYQSVVNEGADAKQMACSNNMMDITMPLMSTFFTMAMPGVIGVYWAFRSWLGLFKSFIMSKVMPLPTFTEEDYKAAAKELAGKKTVVKATGAPRPVRSLHYIDDEDFEDTKERGRARREALEAQAKEEQEAKAAKGSLFGAAPLKKDKKKDEKKAKDEAPAEDAKTEADTDKDNNEV